MDFTIRKYTDLLTVLIEKGYSFQTFAEFLKNPKNKVIILRHDVDLLPYNSLRFSNIQAELGVKGSYYFRAVPESWDENVIKEIASLGHEVGYHYENMDTCNGIVDKAWNDFRFNLDKLRQLVKVKTICMHGSPLSKYDNKELWSKYDYRKLGIIGEPYYDINFDEVFYLTDTGRSWDGWKASIRDKVPQQEEWYKQGKVYHTTNEIISAAKNNQLSDKIMFTMHPERWNHMGFLWLKAFLLQKIKNIFKRILLIIRKKKSTL
tara:strand:- start:1483 stop:2271 length:789 start_codon:yes stop_codon:yes gene_type:complete